MHRMVLALLVGLAGLSLVWSQEPVVWVASPWQHVLRSTEPGGAKSAEIVAARNEYEPLRVIVRAGEARRRDCCGVACTYLRIVIERGSRSVLPPPVPGHRVEPSSRIDTRLGAPQRLPEGRERFLGQVFRRVAATGQPVEPAIEPFVLFLHERFAGGAVAGTQRVELASVGPTDSSQPPIE